MSARVTGKGGTLVNAAKHFADDHVEVDELLVESLRERLQALLDFFGLQGHDLALPVGNVLFSRAFHRF